MIPNSDIPGSSPDAYVFPLTDKQEKYFVLTGVLCSKGVPLPESIRIAAEEYGGSLKELMPEITKQLDSGENPDGVLTGHRELFADDAYTWFASAEDTEEYRDRLLKRAGNPNYFSPPVINPVTGLPEEQSSFNPLQEFLKALKEVQKDPSVTDRVFSDLEQRYGFANWKALFTLTRELLAQKLPTSEILRKGAEPINPDFPLTVPPVLSPIMKAAEKTDKEDSVFSLLITEETPNQQFHQMNSELKDRLRALFSYWQLILKTGLPFQDVIEALESDPSKDLIISILGKALKISEENGDIREALNEYPTLFSPGLTALVAYAHSENRLPEIVQIIPDLIDLGLFEPDPFALPGTPRKTKSEQRLDEVCRHLDSVRDDWKKADKAKQKSMLIAFLIFVFSALDFFWLNLLSGYYYIIPGIILLFFIFRIIGFNAKIANCKDHAYHLEGECIKIQQGMGIPIIE